MFSLSPAEGDVIHFFSLNREAVLKESLGEEQGEEEEKQGEEDEEQHEEMG